MKILFIGDYSNLHACLGKRLRELGHSVTVISDRCGHMQTEADIFLSRGPGKIGAAAYLFRLFSLLPQMEGYDAVQLINPNFLSLRPGKIKYFFDRIKRQNGRIFLTLAGDDHFFVKACAGGELFRFSEYMIGHNPTEMTKRDPARMHGWTSEINRRWNTFLYDRIDGAMSVLPEYDMAARPLLGDRLHFTNLPVDLDYLPFSPLPGEGKTRILVGIRGGMELQKGTTRLLQIAREIERENPGLVEVRMVRDLPLADYLEELKRADIVLDQLYSYSPGTNALQTMALGRVAASGAQPEYYDYIGNPAEKPVFCLDPTRDDLRQRLTQLAADRARMREMSEQGRRLVETHNDVRNVAPRFLEIWQS